MGKAVQPKLTVNIEADNPIEAEVKISEMLDRLLAVVIPTVLAVVIAPFAVLRVLLLGWDCRLTRQDDERTTSLVAEDEHSNSSSSQSFARRKYEQRASRLRSCGVVFCSMSALLMFVTVVILMVAAYVYIIIKSSTEPLKVVLDDD